MCVCCQVEELKEQLADVLHQRKMLYLKLTSSTHVSGASVAIFRTNYITVVLFIDTRAGGAGSEAAGT